MWAGMSWLDPRQWLLVLAFVGAAILGVKFWEHRLVQQGDEAGYSRAQAEYSKAKEKLITETAGKTASPDSRRKKCRS
jgi:hypothetical protein